MRREKPMSEQAKEWPVSLPGYDTALACPTCSDWNGLHLSRVLIGARQGEDGEVIYFSVSADGGTSLLRKDDPARKAAEQVTKDGRRGWAAFVYECEFCDEDETGMLVSMQHKGAELISARTL